MAIYIEGESLFDLEAPQRALRKKSFFDQKDRARNISNISCRLETIFESRFQHLSSTHRERKKLREAMGPESP